MSSPPDARLGVQAPRVENLPHGAVKTLGPEVGDFMRMVGAPLLPWQQHVIDVAFGIRADGKWAAYEVAIWLSRQNGKGRCTEAQELFGAYMLRERKIIHSAHEFDTAGEAFDRLVEIIENCDWLRQRTNKIVRGKGSEGIELTRAMGGGEIRFKARTAHGARGFTGERIILDEAYALTVAQFKAMSPTLATIPNPQITYTSSPPDEKTGPMPEDAITPSIRRRGLSGVEPRLASFEWSPPARKGNWGDRELWYACNPSLGYLIDEEYLQSQFRIFDSACKTDGFAVEHLGLWPDDGGAQWLVIPRQPWEEAAWPDMPRPEPLGFAVSVSEDQSWGAICAAGRVGEDGAGRPLYGVIVVDRRPGLGWLTDRLFELADKWDPVITICDRNSPANEIWAEVENRNLERLGSAELKQLELTPISARDVKAAAAGLYTGIAGAPTPGEEAGQLLNPRNVRHRDQDVLNDAIAGAVKKTDSSGAWCFDPLLSDPVAKGCADALWGFKSRPEPVPDAWVIFR